VTFEKPWIESIMRDCYANFLTDDEIERMLDGKDYWMTGDEVLDRIQKKINKQQELPEENPKINPDDLFDGQTK
jgi:hypothetical protein